MVPMLMVLEGIVTPGVGLLSTALTAVAAVAVPLFNCKTTVPDSPGSKLELPLEKLPSAIVEEAKLKIGFELSDTALWKA